MAIKVIAHRGASGYRPENTLAAFQLGLEQGASGLEFDLVTTLDEQLIIRHENALSGTTNISHIPDFEKYQRPGLVENKEITDWFSEDLNLSQIKQLRAIERLPELRPGSAKFDGVYEIPTFAELLSAKFIENTILVVELKAGTHNTKNFGELVRKEILSSSVLDRKVKTYLESFDFDLLMETKEALKDLPIDYLFALEKTKLQEIDFQGLATHVQGLTISLEMLFAEDWVTNAHAAGLAVWAYTARVEEAETTVEEYYENIIQTGVDAIFADQPDLLRRVLDERGGSTYDY